MIRELKYVSVILFFVCAQPVLADTLIEAEPINWRLQNYVSSPTSIQVGFAGTSCINGTLNFATTATADDKNRFWSLILTAKNTGKTIGVYYETVSGNCNITSFYAK